MRRFRTRCEQADAALRRGDRQLLSESTMTLGQIATALDYADASAFSRAFKRWSGSTAAQWRAPCVSAAD
jgi:AraC-like DNA-binding protein